MTILQNLDELSYSIELLMNYSELKMTGPWGPGSRPPKPAVPGGWGPAAPGGWSLIQGLLGGGNGRGGLLGPGAMQLLDVGAGGGGIALPGQASAPTDWSGFQYCCCECRQVTVWEHGKWSYRWNQNWGPCGGTDCDQLQNKVIANGAAFDSLWWFRFIWSILSTLFGMSLGILGNITIGVVFGLISWFSSYKLSQVSFFSSWDSDCLQCIRECMNRVETSGIWEDVLIDNVMGLIPIWNFVWDYRNFSCTNPWWDYGGDRKWPRAY
jgi:hypothetical protein